MDQDSIDRVPPEEVDGLIFACSLAGAGGAVRLDWEGVESWTPDDPPLWLHVNGAADRVREWLDEQFRLTLRETTDRSQRHIEEIDAARERAIFLTDDVANRLNERLNRNLYVLSIVAAIFLPLASLRGCPASMSAECRTLTMATRSGSHVPFLVSC